MFPPPLPLRFRPERGYTKQVNHDAEASLIDSVVRGEPRAAEALVNQHMPRIYALAYRMLNQEEEAEDVTQEAFIRVWKVLPQWQPRARLSTWLYRVTLNLCRDRLRKSREIIMAEPPEIMDDGLRPEQLLSARQRREAIDGAISRLPERQRTAIILCGLQEMSNAEAGEIMEISVDAVESLLARARRGLRAAIGHRKDLAS